MDTNKLHTNLNVGSYVLGSKDKSNTISINLCFKPKWLHRQCMRIFLGWYWVDNKN